MEKIAYARIAITDTGAGVHINERTAEGYRLVTVGSVYTAHIAGNGGDKFAALLPQLIEQLPPGIDTLQIAAAHWFMANEDMQRKARAIAYPLTVNMRHDRRIRADIKQELRQLGDDSVRGADIFAEIQPWQEAQ